ncbi:DUF4139 domain-containing protein [Neptuniibacter caesariensis]|uniref:DUF4139 domain-containing protein n=1 Tax=Neptuniibacter caesariensis TaxID=207954 RepID=A0A7U8C986_NEPCE|nr:DUF4139 domain-containing protein [Neptuniibacter caesariensis]EAR62469.1 hypothetical protein MED92_15568 [Oceanospirillum sp. MED92] [Neptuniibacter caesariensis]
MQLQKLSLGILIASLSLTGAQAQSLQIGSEQRKAVALTLYNQNLGLVRETRELPPLRSQQEVTLEDVSEQMQVESLRIDNAGQILEQNLNTNLLNQHNLLKHYVGKRLQLARLNPVSGQEVVTEVQLLNIDGNRALIKRNNRFESIPLNNQWRFIYPSLPSNLLSKPSVNFRSVGTSRSQESRISYLTGGLSWGMDYVLTLNEAGNRATLDGRASLTNQTGTDFKNAQISLVAGNLNNPGNARHAEMLQADFAMGAAVRSAPKAMAQEELGDFHLFDLPNKVDLLDGQVKQVAFMNADGIPVDRSYNYEFLVYPTLERNQHRVKPELTLKFRNDQKSKLGLPLPGGKIRTFTPDSKGMLQFAGGSRISHTGKNDEVEIRQGKAFDLSIHRKQTHFSKTFNGFLVGQELRITNTRSTAAKLEMTANFPLTWKMESSSHKYEKVMGGSARWIIDVPAKGDALLKFKVQMEKR